MPIYRGRYFSAYSGTPIAGVPNPNPLAISCTAWGDGQLRRILRRRTGQGAGMMYNLGGNSGAIALGRRGG